MSIDKNQIGQDRIEEAASKAADELGVPRVRILHALREEVFKWEIEAQLDEVVGGVPYLIDTGKVILIESGTAKGKSYACKYLMRSFLDYFSGFAFFPTLGEAVGMTSEDPRSGFIRPTNLDTVRIVLDHAQENARDGGTLLVADNLDDLCYSIPGLHEELSSRVKSDNKKVLLVASVRSEDLDAPFSVKLVRPDEVFQDRRVRPRKDPHDIYTAIARPGAGQSIH